jgi:hypothetical protein
MRTGRQTEVLTREYAHFLGPNFGTDTSTDSHNPNACAGTFSVVLFAGVFFVIHSSMSDLLYAVSREKGQSPLTT